MSQKATEKIYPYCHIAKKDSMGITGWVPVSSRERREIKSQGNRTRFATIDTQRTTVVPALSIEGLERKRSISKGNDRVKVKLLEQTNFKYGVPSTAREMSLSSTIASSISSRSKPLKSQ